MGLRFRLDHGLLLEFTDGPVTMPHRAGSYFHLHLVSDATGETYDCCAGRYRAMHEGVAGRARPSAGAQPEATRSRADGD